MQLVRSRDVCCAARFDRLRHRARRHRRNAAPCANPNALGVSRVMTVSARDMPLIGSHDYGVTLPLAAGEVVLTFDDGPQRPTPTQCSRRWQTNACRRSFSWSAAKPAPIPNWPGRSVPPATPSAPTPRTTCCTACRPTAQPGDRRRHRVGRRRARRTRALAPFFRFPGLFRTAEAEQLLRARGLMAGASMSTPMTGRGSARPHARPHTGGAGEAARRHPLMHDVQPKTALTLPTLLRELKARGYRIVHVVPAGASAVRTFSPAHRRSRGCKRRPSPRAARAAPEPSRAGRTPARHPRPFAWPRRPRPVRGDLYRKSASLGPLSALLLVTRGRFCWIGRGGSDGPLLRPDQVPARQVL